MSSMTSSPLVLMCTRHGTGGAQLNATRLFSALKQQGAHVQLRFFYAADDTPVPDGAKVYWPHPPKTALEALKMLRAVVRDLRHWKPSAVLGFHPLANIIAGLAWFFCGCQRRLASHRNPPDSQRSAFRIIDLMLGTLPFYTKIICVSEDVARCFESYPASFRNKIEVIHNGLPNRQSCLEKIAARKKFGLMEEAFYFGCVARLHPQKNQALLIKLMPTLPQEMHLVLAGDGPLRHELEALALSLGVSDRVTFQGRISVDDVPDFLAALDVFAFPSAYEGFGLSLIEAAQQGLPIVASDIAVFRELLGPADHTAGCLAPLDAPADWARLLLQIKNDSSLKESLSRGALARASFFSLDHMVAAYKKALTEGEI